MLFLVARRLRDLAVMILVMTFLTLLMLEAIPGGYCSMALPDHADNTTRQTCEQAKEPSLEKKYIAAIGQLARFDLGRSLSSGRSVKAEIAEQLPATVTLALISLTLSLTIGLAGGLAAAQGRYRPWGRLLNWIGIGLLSLPSFVLALLLMQFFALRLQWLRILGDAEHWQSLVMPVLAITIPLSAIFMRITRNAVVDVLNRDYIRTAYAKGLHVRQIVTYHALRNALAAIIPFAGLVLAGLLDGTLLIEAIFARPGLGRYTFKAVQTQDYPALHGVVLVVLVLTAMTSLLADITHARLLPLSRSDVLRR